MYVAIAAIVLNWDWSTFKLNRVGFNLASGGEWSSSNQSMTLSMEVHKYLGLSAPADVGMLSILSP